MLAIACTSLGIASFGNILKHLTSVDLMPKWIIVATFCVSIVAWVALPFLVLLRRHFIIKNIEDVKEDC